MNEALVIKHFRKSTKLSSCCALCNLSFLLIKHEPLPEKKDYDILAAPPPSHIFIPIKIFFQFCRWCSRRQPEDVICLPLTCEPDIDDKKDHETFLKNYWGRFEKCFAHCARQGKEGEPISTGWFFLLVRPRND